MSSVYDGTTEWSQSLQTDVRGRVTFAQSQTGATNLAAMYSYTGAGRVQHVSTPAGNWTYNYVAGQLQQIAMDAGPTVAQVYARDGLGRATDVGLAFGGQLQRSYDTNGRVESETIQSGLGNTALTYTYHTLGQLEATDRSGTLGARRDEYLYTREGWLDSEIQDATSVSPLSTAYTYDQAGNRTLRQRTQGAWSEYTATTYAYGNRLDTVSVDGALPEPMIWDGYGEVVERWDGTTFDRYPDGSELAITNPDSTVLADIVRDAFGRPVQVDDGDVAPTIQLWGNPGSELRLGGIGADGAPFANVTGLPKPRTCSPPPSQPRTDERRDEDDRARTPGDRREVRPCYGWAVEGLDRGPRPHEREQHRSNGR